MQKTNNLHSCRILFTIFVLYLFVWNTNYSIAQDEKPKKQLTPELTLKKHRIGNFQFSPDGNMLAMTVTEPVKGLERNTDIWMYNLREKELFRFTTSKKFENNPRWSPDGKILAFLTNRDKKTQIYFMYMRGGEAEAFTKWQSSIRSFEWSPHGNQIAFLATIPETEDEKKAKEEKDDEQVIDKDDKHPLLHIIDIKSKKTKIITTEEWRIEDFTWMPSSDKLIVVATNNPQPELETNRVYSVPADSGEMCEIAAPVIPFGGLKISPDGKYIAFKGTHTTAPQAHDLFIIPSQGGKAKNLSRTKIGRSVNSFQWTENGSIFAQFLNGFSNDFYKIQIEGKVEKIKPTTNIIPGSFLKKGKILAFIGQNAQIYPELWISTNQNKAKKISHFNTALDTIQLAKPEIIQYTSFDGLKIEASLFKPANFEKKLYPLIILIHGGPTARWSDRFNSWAQLLAGRGYLVLCPNIRGSTGYGFDFLAKNRRDWGGADYKDILAGAEFLIDKGIADENHIGIGGWSYGGYMAAWAVTQTQLFQASVSGAPMTDLAFEYGTEISSINAYDTWFMGTPYENLQLFIDRSPVTHVKHVKTPILILCGENDSIDPVEQCHQFYRGLKRYGVETELVIYPREGHSLREEKHQVDMLNRMLDWFDKYLK